MTLHSLSGTAFIIVCVYLHKSTLSSYSRPVLEGSTRQAAASRRDDENVFAVRIHVDHWSRIARPLPFLSDLRGLADNNVICKR